MTARTRAASTTAAAATAAPATAEAAADAAATTTTEAAAERALVTRVGALVAERARLLAAQGRTLGDLGDLDELAARMVSALPTQHPYDEPLGPFYDTTGLVSWLGVSRQAVADRVRRGTLLACRTQDGHLVYPAWQFARDGAVRPGVVEAVGEFARRGADGWSTALWLTTPSDVFGGQSAVDYLVVHRASRAAVQLVASTAALDARTWAA
jgi:hypothetical protein